VGLVDEDEGMETMKPMIDGGTEGTSRFLCGPCVLSLSFSRRKLEADFSSRPVRSPLLAQASKDKRPSSFLPSLTATNAQ